MKNEQSERDKKCSMQIFLRELLGWMGGGCMAIGEGGEDCDYVISEEEPLYICVGWSCSNKTLQL